MLEVIRDSILPFAKPADGRNLELSRALSFFRQNPKGNVQMLAEFLGCSKRTAERIVAELKSSGDLKGVGSNRAGSWLVED